jgi:hypothetical protein
VVVGIKVVEVGIKVVEVVGIKVAEVVGLIFRPRSVAEVVRK